MVLNKNYNWQKKKKDNTRAVRRNCMFLAARLEWSQFLNKHSFLVTAIIFKMSSYKKCATSQKRWKQRNHGIKSQHNQTTTSSRHCIWWYSYRFYNVHNQFSPQYIHSESSLFRGHTFERSFKIWNALTQWTKTIMGVLNWQLNLSVWLERECLT